MKPISVVAGIDPNLGETICSRLVADGHEVVACFPLPLQSAHTNVTGDYREPLANQMAMAKVSGIVGRSPVHVIHTGIENQTDMDAAPGSMEVIALASFMRELGLVKVKQLTFCSSLEPIQAGEVSRITESSPTYPATEKCQALLDAEQEIWKDRRGIPSVVLRFGHLYDELIHSPMLCKDILADMTGKPPEPAMLEPKEFYPFLHTDDAAKAISAVQKRAGNLEHDALIHITEPRIVSRHFIHEHVTDFFQADSSQLDRFRDWVHQVGHTITHALTSPPGLPMAEYWFDISRANQLLSWWPEHDLSQEFDDLLLRLQNNPHQWFAENGLAWKPERFTNQVNRSLGIPKHG